MRAQQVVAAGVMATMLFALPTPSSGASSDRRLERARAADSLHRRAIERLAVGTLDARRQAMSELEQASLLAPGDHRVWLDLGRLCLECGQRKRGRECYEHARRAAPDDAEAHVELGSAWTWEWLNSFESTALVEAERCLARATELAPGRPEVWAKLSALSLARGRLDQAERAAVRGLAADPQGWDPMVALACAAWRRGQLARADSAFVLARERVPDALRARFAAAPWGADDRAGPGPGAIGDPDLTTPENEAELDYLTRLGLALLLFRDVHGVRWDMRTELFVRYGPPATVDVNPLYSPLSFAFPRPEQEYRPPGYVSYAPPPIEYAYNMQAWAYPELGMHAELWDRSLTQRFELPPVSEDYADPRPNPMLLAMRPDLVSIGGGRGVFRAMAPGSRPIAAAGQVERFPSEHGVLLLAHVVTAGEPTDTLRGGWAVVAADGRVVARGSRMLAGSACDPAALRVAEFSATVQPGDYRVDLSVSGSGGRRGLVRLEAAVEPPSAGLDLSNMVMVCGGPDLTASNEPVRIEPNFERRIAGDGPLTVYLEIDHLTAGSDGLSRFAYTYSLHRVERDEKRPQPAVYQASREDTHDGPLRRQFITVPMRSIKSGTYDLRVEVRDLVAGTQVATELRFERE